MSRVPWNFHKFVTLFTLILKKIYVKNGMNKNQKSSRNSFDSCSFHSSHKSSYIPLNSVDSCSFLYLPFLIYRSGLALLAIIAITAIIMRRKRTADRRAQLRSAHTALELERPPRVALKSVNDVQAREPRE